MAFGRDRTATRCTFVLELSVGGVMVCSVMDGLLLGVSVVVSCDLRSVVFLCMHVYP